MAELMAMEMAPAVIHLKEVSTGRTVAQLEDPFGDRSNMISFTHEGTKLIVLSTYASAIHVWDLRAIRSHLRPLGLDWDWPGFSEPTVETAMSNSREPIGNPAVSNVTAAAKQSPATNSTARTSMSEVTRTLTAIEQGDTAASEDLLPLVYNELRRMAAHKMAGEPAGHTLQPTALVHEAWLKLVDSPAQSWQNRAHFFGAAAEAMRRILIDRARRKSRQRRGSRRRAPGRG